MKTAMINIKTEQEVKEQAQQLAAELGFSLSALVTASLKQFVRTREVQFSALPRMTPYLEGVIEQVEKDLKTKKNLSPAFTNAKEASAYLRKLT
jgi:addiction module RelB/DinJ family antitoxin